MQPFATIKAALGPRSAGAYECKTCEESFDVQYHVCPACDGFSVEARAGSWDGVDRTTGSKLAAVRGRQ